MNRKSGSLRYHLFSLIFFWVSSAHSAFDSFDLHTIDRIPQVGRTAALSTVVVFNKSGLQENDDGSYKIIMDKMYQVPNTNASIRRFCPDEQYAGRMRARGARSTGVLISPVHVLLAGHGADGKNDCENQRYIFNFSSEKGQALAHEVYKCKKVRDIRLDSNESLRPKNYGLSPKDGSYDYAIIELDRPVAGFKPICLKRTKDLRPGKKLLFIASLRGLPLSWQEATIRSHVSGTISTDADTAPGASGGLYVDPLDGCLVGIHSEFNNSKSDGETDENDFTDSENKCLRWVFRSSVGFNFESTLLVEKKGVDRLKGSLMVPFYNFLGKVIDARVDAFGSSKDLEGIQEVRIAK